MQRDAAKLKRLLRVQTVKALQSKANLSAATAHRAELAEKLQSIDALCQSNPQFEFVYGDQVHSFRSRLATQMQAAEEAEVRAMAERINAERKVDRVDRMRRSADQLEERAKAEKDLSETIQRMAPDGK